MDTAVHFPTTPKAVTAKRVKLGRRLSVEQAFGRIMDNCIAQVQANDSGVARFHDEESLHQMRVGLRRMRSALAIFKEVVNLPPTLQVDLDWLVESLGPARDWDVLAGATLGKVARALPEAAAVAALRAAALAKAHGLLAAAADAVGSVRYARFLLALQNWVAGRGWRQALVPGDKAQLKSQLSTFADAVLNKAQGRLCKRGAKLSGASDAARHRVRIAAKKARYASEFFGALYPARTLTPYLKALSRLQDTLGAMNDAAVAATLLAELNVELNAELSAPQASGAAVGQLPAMAQGEAQQGRAYVLGYLAGRTDNSKKALRQDWKRFAAATRPWTD